MNQLNVVLKDAQVRNENNKRETRNYLTKVLVHYNNENVNSQTSKQEFILIDEDSNESSSQVIQPLPQQKVKYIDILKKRQEEKDLIPKDLFTGKIFIMFMRTINLTEKRIKIFSDQIKQNQGEVYLTIQEYFEKFQTFYLLIQEKNKYIFFICPDEAKIESRLKIKVINNQIQDIRKELQIYNLNIDVVLNRVIKVEYLVETLKQKKYLSVDSYCKLIKKSILILIYAFIHIQMYLTVKNLIQQKIFHLCKYLKKQKLLKQIIFKIYRCVSSELKQLKTESKENGKSQLLQQVTFQNEDSQALTNDKISSDDDSNMDSQNFDIECLTNVTRDIIKKRKATLDKCKKRANKKSRYLWDYNYDSNQEQDSTESEQSSSSKGIITIDSNENLPDIDYADKQITPLKVEQDIFLSKITEKEEQSAPKSIFKSYNKKLKRCVSESEDETMDEFINQKKTNVITSNIKEQQLSINFQKNIQQLFSNQKSPLKQRPLLDYYQSDSDNKQDKQEEFEEEEFEEDEFDEEEFQQIDQRFIKEISSIKKEPSKEQTINLNNQNNFGLKSLKKNPNPISNPIEIIQLESDEDDDIEFDEKNNKMKNLNNNNIVTESIEINPFKPFSGQIRRERYWDERKNHFVCATGAPKENLNKLITDELEKLLKIYQQEKDTGRSIAYRKAVGVIKSLDFQITSIKDIQKINGIGDKTKEKIKEILKTGQCQRAQILTQNERNQSIELLSKVWGIGPTTAASLYDKGIKSIEDLRQNQHLLNKNQKIGLAYFEDLVDRMSRDEATQIIEEIKKGFNELFTTDYDRYDIIACGSYRRGKETCGDVDVLICRKDGEENKPKKLMFNLVCKLEQDGLLAEHLQLPRVGSYGSETYMGIGKLKCGRYRRIDLKYYPKDLYGYALLYFTGSDYFNRSMRLFARKKGYSLSDHGLYAVSRINNKTKMTSSLAIPCYSEEEVFAALNLEYKPPAMRSV